jgi:hypothetical protein
MPISRRDLVQKLKRFEFKGPYSGGRPLIYCTLDAALFSYDRPQDHGLPCGVYEGDEGLRSHLMAAPGKRYALVERVWDDY